MIKIAITGPESSGKTTLATDLGRKFRVSPVPEYARYYFSNDRQSYNLEDIERIAEGQWILYNLYSINQEVLICDTDFLVLKVWAQDKFSSVSSFITNRWKTIQFDLYLLCKPNLEWQPDPLRENPYDRDRLFDIYLQELQTANKNYGIVDEVDPNVRFFQASSIIDQLL